jgi:hypothetical protein
LGAAAKKLLSGDFAGALAEVRTGIAQTKTIAKDLGGTLSEIWSEETTGQKIRARIAEVEKMGAVSQAAKPQIDMREQIDGNTKAEREQVKAHQEVAKAIELTSRSSEYRADDRDHGRKRIEVDKSASRAADREPKSSGRTSGQKNDRRRDHLASPTRYSVRSRMARASCSAFRDTLKVNTFKNIDPAAPPSKPSCALSPARWAASCPAWARRSPAPAAAQGAACCRRSAAWAD